MMRCKEMCSLFALIVPFAIGAALVPMSSSPVRAAEQLPDLCIAAGVDLPGELTGAGCEYSDKTAPVLKSEVCWDGFNTRIKPVGAGCLPHEVALFATFGEVLDPYTGEVRGYAPLPTACAYVPCEPSDFDSQQLADGVACCNPQTNECVPPDANGVCPVGNITWCKEVEDNGNGTVTCHE